MLDFFKGTVTPKDWMFVGAVLGVAAALCVAFYAVVYQKQVAALADEQAKVTSISAQLKKATEIDEQFETYQLKYKEMEQLVELFEKRLPEQREIQALIAQFEEEGRKLGLLVELKPEPPKADAKKETYPYMVTATGRYHDIVNFINLFERNDRYLKVSELSVKEQKDGVTEASFRLSTFVFKQDTAAALASAGAAS